MKKIIAVVFMISLSPFSMVSAGEPQVVPQRELAKQFLGHDRREQAKVDREAYRAEQPSPHARRELAQEMRQLQEHKRAPASESK